MRGITLAELLIAFIIVSMMMVGVFAVNNAILRMNNSATYRSNFLTRTKTVVDTIERDARNAVGTIHNIGICLNSFNNNHNYICFRNLHYPRSVPDSYDWNCYTHLNEDGSDHGANMRRCTYPDTSIPTGTHPTACVPAGYACCDTADQWIGTVAFDLLNVVAVPSFSFTNGFTMIVVNRQDPTVAASDTNPEVRPLISAQPQGHSSR